MLLEFRVTNFRSIRDEQLFTLLPLDRDETLSESNVRTTENKQVGTVLKSAVLYGANASGKSNLVRAMAFFQSMVRDSATQVQAGQGLNVQPFALEEGFRSKPSGFEITALVDGVRYQYGFEATAERIHAEWLLVYKSFKPQEWFSRKWRIESETDEYEFSKSYFSGSKDVWKTNTRSNGLFLSTAVQLNSDQLRPLWNWISTQLVILESGTPLFAVNSVQLIDTVRGKARVLDFLNAADLGIANVEVARQKGFETSLVFEMATGRIRPTDPIEKEQTIPQFRHEGPLGVAIFNFQDESEGTQKLFALAGIILKVLESGQTLVVDELENSLHPHLVRFILQLFHSTIENPSGSQLVFTTHNTSIMENDLFRRDQIWFAEKGADLATKLFALTEFQGVRSSDTFAKKYLEGRYGAVPITRTPELDWD